MDLDEEETLSENLTFPAYSFMTPGQLDLLWRRFGVATAISGDASTLLNKKAKA